MARHTTQRQAKAQDDNAIVETLSNAPLDEMPEQPNTMTPAAMAATPRDPVVKGDAKALTEASSIEKSSDAPKVRWFRVTADRNITGASGYRSRMRAGKEFSSTMYNPSRLRVQGVQFVEIDESERTMF